MAGRLDCQPCKLRCAQDSSGCNLSVGLSTGLSRRQSHGKKLESQPPQLRESAPGPCRLLPTASRSLSSHHLIPRVTLPAVECSMKCIFLVFRTYDLVDATGASALPLRMIRWGTGKGRQCKSESACYSGGRTVDVLCTSRRLIVQF